jgi:acetyltransferase-like isoleucine patch superfamily enzyme
MIFVENSRNESTISTKRLENCSTVLMHPLSEVRNTSLEGNYEIGMYSSVNRSILKFGGGIATESYVSDTVIGAYTLIGSRVSVGGFEHPKDWLSIGAFQWGQSTEHWNISFDAQKRLEKQSKPKPVQTVIGPDCWLGNNSVVLSSVTIGAGAIIGAGCVVTKDVPPYSICVGNPGKIIGKRFSESVISQLLELEWWNLDIEDISSLNLTNIEESLSKIRQIRGEQRGKNRI